MPFISISFAKTWISRLDEESEVHITAVTVIEATAAVMHIMGSGDRANIRGGTSLLQVGVS